MKVLFINLSLVFCLYFFSCNQSDPKEKFATLNDSLSLSGLTGDSVKLVKTAGINFKVKDVEQSARSISTLARKFGGMLFNQSYEGAGNRRNELKISADSLMVISTYTPQADITARVPAENLEEFMYGVADLGYFTESHTLNIDDKSIEYLENILKQKNRKDVLSPGKVKSLTDIQTIGVKDQIINRQMADRVIDAEANYSLVHITLKQNSLVRKEIIANYVIADYQLPFSKRLLNSLNDGWQYFLSFFIIIANLWVFILVTILAFIFYKSATRNSKALRFTMKP
ncbi:MAG: DUF4349 domain-containing protein [Ginsengibacter sp.]